MTRNLAIRLGSKERAIFIAIVVLVLTVILLYVSGFFRKNVVGELLYDFQYADRYPWTESWKVYYFDRVLPRFMLGVSLTFLYEIVGFNPPIMYLISFFLHLTTVAIIIVSIKDLIPRPWLVGLLTITFAFLPLLISNAMTLQVFDTLYAFSAILLFKQYIRTEQIGFLLGAAFFQIVAALTSEQTLLALPLAILISLPYIKSIRNLASKTICCLVICFSGLVATVFTEGVLGGGSRIIGFLHGDYGSTHGQNSVGFSEFISTIWNNGLAGYLHIPDLIFSFIYKIIILVSVLAALIALVRGLSRKGLVSADPKVSLALSGIYLGFVFWLPYALAGLNRPVDALLGMAVGVIFISLAGYFTLTEILNEQFSNLIFVLICIFWITAGATEYTSSISLYSVREFRMAEFVTTLKDQVPNVKENTTFVFVNAGFSRTGDIGLLKILYERLNIRTIHLFDNDTEETYTWQNGMLLEDSGRTYESDFIIVTFGNDGEAQLISEFKKDDFPLLPITWLSREPISTNRSRIIKRDDKEQTQFYMYQIRLLNNHKN